jgi:hypothetical protein
MYGHKVLGITLEEISSNRAQSIWSHWSSIYCEKYKISDSNLNPLRYSKYF